MYNKAIFKTVSLKCNVKSMTGSIRVILTVSLRCKFPIMYWANPMDQNMEEGIRKKRFDSGAIHIAFIPIIYRRSETV
jgi:hypothetical protein